MTGTTSSTVPTPADAGSAMVVEDSVQQQQHTEDTNSGGGGGGGGEVAAIPSSPVNKAGSSEGTVATPSSSPGPLHPGARSLSIEIEGEDEADGGAAAGAASKGGAAAAALSSPSTSFAWSTSDDNTISCLGRALSRKRVGVSLASAGAILVAMAAILQGSFPSIYKSQLSRKLAATDMATARRVTGFLSNKDLATPSHVSFYFYNITNSAAFLKGQAPKYDLLGPYVYRTYYQKVDLIFAKDRSWVEFATKHQAVFLPNLSVGPQTDAMTIANMGYITGLSRKRSESGMLKSAVRTMIKLFQMGTQAKLGADLGAMLLGGWGNRDGDLLNAAKAVKAAMGDDVFYDKWVSGGFRDPEVEKQLTQLLNIGPEDAAYYRALLDVSPDMPASTPLTAAQAQALLDPTNAKGLVANTNGPNKPRQGLLQWVVTPLPADVDLTTATAPAAPLTPAQVKGLGAFAQRIAKGPTGWEAVLVPRLVAAMGIDVPVDQYKTINDLVWRQYTVTDVLSKLGQLEADVVVGSPLSPPLNRAPYVSSTADLPVDLWEVGGFLRTKRDVTPDTLDADWEQQDRGRCLVDVISANKTYYETEVLGIPAVFASPPDFTHHDELEALPVKRKVQDCFGAGPSGKQLEGEAWLGVQAYITNIALVAVKPMLQGLVIDQKGGLIASRPVKEWILGHVEPLLPLSLGRDNPAAMGYAILPHSPALDGGPSYCISSADMNNGGSSCYLDTAASNATHKAWRRTRSRFLTGTVAGHKKKDLGRLMALDRYEGQTNITLLDKHVPISGGARHLPGSVQWGLSTGEQFPPLALQKAGPGTSLYLIRLRGPMVLKFTYEKENKYHGINLKQFTFDPSVFDSTRDGASYLNGTFINMSPLYISTDPKAGLDASSLTVGQAVMEAASKPSMLGVEPITGKTVMMRITTQLSTSLTDASAGDLDVYYKEAHRPAMFPFMYVVQDTHMAPADVAYFKHTAFTPREAAKVSTAVGYAVGLALLIAGAIILSLAPRRLTSSSAGDAKRTGAAAGAGGSSPVVAAQQQ